MRVILAAVFIIFSTITISSPQRLRWNIDRPYRYRGYIYSDSISVILNAIPQINLTKANEEICNFQLNQSPNDTIKLKVNPFRAIVKSARLGLAEIQLKPNTSVKQWENNEFSFLLFAGACHNPDRRSEPAEISIKIYKPPLPIWANPFYSAVVNTSVKRGTFILKVTASLPKSADPENRICQYTIEEPKDSPFRIDAEGKITVRSDLSDTELNSLTLLISSQDCSQPVRRKSEANVYITFNRTCKVGWKGFYPVINYIPGSGVHLLGKDVRFKSCGQIQMLKNHRKYCASPAGLRVTTSVELQSSALQENRNVGCKLDYISIRMEENICDINVNQSIDLLSGFSTNTSEIRRFPFESSIFSVASFPTPTAFSLFFWMKRQLPEKPMTETIICEKSEGGTLFSLSLFGCSIKIETFRGSENNKMKSTITWEFSVPQICDEAWHHIFILLQRDPKYYVVPEIRLFIDGETVEKEMTRPNFDQFSSHKFEVQNSDIFLGRCADNEDSQFRGLLAGVIILPNVALKSSVARCLVKCNERLHFSGMNQMSPGMSVSLNSEMQMIIINGHSVSEVNRLVRLIGYAHPDARPLNGVREIYIDTEISCDSDIYRVPPVKIALNISKTNVDSFVKKSLATIKLISSISTVLVPDSLQINPSRGSGLSIFSNVTIMYNSIPASTKDVEIKDPVMLSKCVISFKPNFIQNQEYFEWSSDALEAIKSKDTFIQVSNSSNSLILQGPHNYMIYEFLIQNLRYFSTVLHKRRHYSTRIFRLQCFGDERENPSAESDILVVKVITWFNPDGSSSTTNTLLNIKSDTSIFDSVTHPKESPSRDSIEMHAISNFAKMNDDGNYLDKESSAKGSKVETGYGVYYIMLMVGLLVLFSVVTIIVKKVRRANLYDSLILPYQIVDCFCFPLQSIRQRLHPTPSVKVELTRDFLSRTFGRRREIGLEMQWDDTELKASKQYNIISNPLCENAYSDIDDNYLNKDVPPMGEDEAVTDEESDGDTSEDCYNSRSV